MSDSLDHVEQPRQTTSRLGSKITAGEIVEVQGGHIVRSIGRKDRHSKVCTAKGPRDRRVRLSAHTAIQFYDVQDRLGYDRPSKAVDWLIKKAKTAIDELAELPAWNPTSHLSSISNLSQEQPQKRQLGIQQSDVVGCGDVAVGSSSKRAMTMVRRESEAPQGLQQQCSNFLPPSLDSESIADTIKSFFPVGGGGASNGGSSSRMQFQSFPPPELLSRSSSQSQELRLSLQSFQDPISLHHHQHHVPQNQNQASVTEQQAHVQGHSMFSGANNLGFDVSGWSEQQQQPIDFSRFQRLNAWNSCGNAPNSGGAAGGYLFSSQPVQQQQQPLLQQILGQNQVFSQRGPLQSSNSPSFRAWMDPSMLAIATADHNIQQQQQQQQQQYQAVHPIYPSSSAIGFASGIGGISGSFIPARIRGEREEQHDGLADKPSSASSDSHH